MNKFPLIKERLEKEILITNSFFEPTLEPNFNLHPFSRLSELLAKEYEVLDSREYLYLYDQIYKKYPIIKVKVSPAVFESWLMFHGVLKLKEILGANVQS